MMDSLLPQFLNPVYAAFLRETFGNIVKDKVLELKRVRTRRTLLIVKALLAATKFFVAAFIQFSLLKLSSKVVGKKYETYPLLVLFTGVSAFGLFGPTKVQK
jgi:hypothetical protein